MSHPSDRDLINFARDELGAAKKNRILEHCRGCPACAGRLIEATREHAPDPGPVRLSRWNKISLVALALALIALVVTMVWFVRQLGDPALPAPPAAEDPLR